MRTLIGFDTASKKQAQKELNKKSNGKVQQAQEDVSMDKLKQQTVQRLSQLGGVICSNEFQKYPQEQRQQILLDFAYFSKVADTVL